MDIKIRKAKLNDLEDIKSIIARAKVFMAANGNPSQWGRAYPDEAVLIKDIENENAYVCTTGEKVIGTFSLIFGDEVTYKNINEGAWSEDLPYGTIHRLASDGSVCGLAQIVFDFAKAQINYLRVDTHRDNEKMLAAIEMAGFKKCGIIYVADGSERLAFDFVKK